MLHTTSELEQTCDTITRLVLLTEKRRQQNLQSSTQTDKEILLYADWISQFLSFCTQSLHQNASRTDMSKAFQLSKMIRQEHSKLRLLSVSRLKKSGDATTEMMLTELITTMEHISDHALNISQELSNLTKEKGSSLAPISA